MCVVVFLLFFSDNKFKYNLTMLFQRIRMYHVHDFMCFFNAYKITNYTKYWKKNKNTTIQTKFLSLLSIYFETLE